MRRLCLHSGFAALMMAVFLVLTGLYGCGGGSGDTAGQQSDQGRVVVSLTDAPGDFAAYTVDVLSLTLTKANGAQVSTLPLETRIDFTQYTDMTEFLTAATVPSGAYVAATLTLDYSNAEIWVENESGDSVQVAPENILDGNGDPITVLEMTVHLRGRNRLPIAPGIPAHLLLDFDLTATHQVDLEDPQVPVITVDPLLVADVNRSHLKLHRVRGALKEVSVAQSSFSLYLRPFYCPLSGGHRHFGSHTVSTTGETLFEIDGTPYTGGAGLDAMAALDPLTAVIAMGDLKFDPLRFEARQVYAGSSVPGGTMDVVKGNVISRQGDELTVKGATLIRGESSVIFNDAVTVYIGDHTLVTRQLSDKPLGAYGKDDISVGQQVVIFGTLTEADDEWVLDAGSSGSHVRMMMTTVRGTALSVDESADTLLVELQTIDHRFVDLFDFSGTNSDPDNYRIDTGELDLSLVRIASPLKARGFVEPFGSAPPDFSAHTLVMVADLQALMKVNWDPAGSAAFQNVSTDGFTLSLEGVGGFHHIFRGGVATDLTQLNASPALVPQDDGQGIFVLSYADRSYQLFFEFDGFAEALAADLDDHLQVKACHAVGDFDDDGAVLTAHSIEIKFAAGKLN
ncbi:MAG: DUF4382 domain-containing protein [Desulfobacteraceae bacterium]